jgi:hypothetical protein
MAITWITPAGNLGVETERVILSKPLVATSPNGPITFSLIAGNLPRGLRVDRNVQYNEEENITTGFIKGSPVEVRKLTEYKFVIRANDNVDIEDRTFTITIDGADDPEWITREGFLNVGNANAFFVLDNSYVNFKLEAIDKDTTAGEILEYFLLPKGGELPPGLSLSKDGVISGFTDPIFSLDYQDNDTGGYDTGSFDTSPLDFGKNNSLGYDSYFYDNVDYDFGENAIIPRRLSRIYTFAVGVSDGATIVPRIFKIYVVTEEFLKADNTLVQVDTNIFTADSTKDRIPIWVTESNLGQFRANNYVTIFLDVYDPPTLTGTITYFLLSTNPGKYKLKSTGEIITDGAYEVSGKFPFFPISNVTANSPIQWEVIEPETESITPPGLELDSTTGELAGVVPFQPRVFRDYKFTMLAVDFPVTLLDANYELVGDWDSNITYQANQAVRYEGFIFIANKANRNIIPVDGDTWSIGVSSSSKTFTVTVVGEVESGIKWITNNDLGTIKPNQPSQLSVQAEALLYGGRVIYELSSGILPPGLSFLPNGAIIGKVKQFADSNGLGLTRFYDLIDPNLPDTDDNRRYDVFFDDGGTTFDKEFTFTVRARDTANFAENFKEFKITVIADSDKTFANLYVKAFQPPEKRLDWFDFISDVDTFDPRDLYRYGDPNFGVQPDLKMLVFAGIESTDAVKYVQAMSRNHYRKRLLFGDVKMAKAKDPDTQETIYEVIYVDIIDEYEKNRISISDTVELPDYINSKVLTSFNAIKVDSDIPFASDSDHQRVFPNSIKNMRKRIRNNVGDRDRSFLPLWMRSIQDSAQYELGYTKALILCYAKPGRGNNIMSKIRGKTNSATRGDWLASSSYQVNDSVRFKNQFYTCLKANSNKIPDRNPEFWSKNFDFKDINFVADRYIIDIIDGEVKDKYLAFPQRGEKLP